ncbi:Tetraspanin-11 [Amphibalanus amphitrite]|uniref:Tetraspanin n=1 Tax=Amphibalanus amphitrite TaxID=1232801 RepID=A0A6A4W102_AMPAM|nr:CD151 antigen-like [Amphibalanus amphitrite]XP_043205352.1 CD151 antigen-like [Amphibalanus amphitrite]KAF0300896.1 Tetraspanin-11 [Amphibalanus amphitrite]KAF0300897.1 Tetraspanin-11 [Amphibalanus amphitrite]
MGKGQEMEGCGQCVKYLLFFSNFLILVGGVAVLAIGIWTVVDKTEFEQLLGTDLYASSAYIFVATGVVVTLISFLGCLGAIKEVRCMLFTYFIILLVLFVVLLVGGIVSYVFRHRVKDTIMAQMMASQDEYETNQAAKDAWDAAQSQMECCGVTGPASWTGHVSPLPDSCCPGPVEPGSCTLDDSYQAGCKQRVQEFVMEHAAVLGGVGVGIAFVLFLGMVLSMALFKMIV